MEKSTRFKKAYEYLRSVGLAHTQKDIADMMQATPQNVSAAMKGRTTALTTRFLSRFNEAYGNIFNIDWLVYGEGDMLRTTPTSAITNSNIITGGTNTNVNLSVSNATSDDIEEAEVIEDTAPIIPPVWVKRPDFDIMRMTEEQWDTLEHSKVSLKELPLDAWYLMPDNSMSPYYMKGDKVGLIRQVSMKIVPGCIYGIDTNTHGMLIRALYEAEGGYRAEAINDEKFPNFFIANEETISISRVAILVRL